jgi:hypothetical protein
MEHDIRFDPRYEAMTFEAATFICDKFSADFGYLNPNEVDKHPEGALARSLYAVALGWLVLEDRWQEAGVDPEFVAMLIPTVKQINTNRAGTGDRDEGAA